MIQRLSLPIDSALKEIVNILTRQHELILVAEPGAGKSTRVPMACLSDLASTGKWLVLQPRRWAARQVAGRIAEENQLRLGVEVGYQIRNENRTSAQTRLIIMTDGILLRMIQSDPELTGIDGIILDEFHERGLETDLSLALLKEIRHELRPDLKIIVMSATLDVEGIKKFLPMAGLIEVPGRTFPVDIEYLGSISIANAVVTALADFPNQGDGLVFLPGQGEIKRAIQICEDQVPHERLKNLDLLPLYAQLPESEQKKVFAPPSLGSNNVRRRIIFATNIAETSITLPGIRFVIDTGEAKVMRNDPQLGQDRLETLRISRASSIQRAGRAGRVSHGKCYRLWTEAEQQALRHFEVPEVHRLNLTSTLLYLAEYGVKDPKKFDWFDPPRASSLERAQKELVALGWLDDSTLASGTLTAEGRAAARLPLSANDAKLWMVASRFGPTALAFAARLILLGQSRSGGEQRSHDWRSFFQALNAVPKNLFSILPRSPRIDDSALIASDEFIELCQRILLLALPTRIFIDGKSVGRRRLLSDPNLPKIGWMVASREVTRKEGPLIQVSSSLPITENQIEAHVVRQRKVSWDSAKGRARVQVGQFFQDLEWGSQTDMPPTAEEIKPALMQAIRPDPEAFFRKNEEFANWLDRFRIYEKLKGKIDFPWEAVIDAATEGANDLDAVLRYPILDFLMSTDPAFQKVDQLLPDKITVPTGNRIRIDYSGDTPKLSVRLQECFGMGETPKIADGKIELLMELLSPGFKPIQLTKDLKSFWDRGYFEVRRELKARYPKHSWPEDPWKATPVFGRVKR